MDLVVLKGVDLIGVVRLNVGFYFVLGWVFAYLFVIACDDCDVALRLFVNSVVQVDSFMLFCLNWLPYFVGF